MAAPTLERRTIDGRDPQVPEVHRAAEDRDRARVAARPEDDRASSAASTTSPRRLLASGASSSSPAGAERLQGKAERTEADELRRQVSRARAGAGPQDDGGRGRGGTLAGLGVSVRVARSRELVAQGRPAAVVARVAGISRQAIYRTPEARRRAGQRRPLDDDRRGGPRGRAQENATDGTRMVAALAPAASSAGRSTASACSG